MSTDLQRLETINPTTWPVEPSIARGALSRVRMSIAVEPTGKRDDVTLDELQRVAGDWIARIAVAEGSALAKLDAFADKLRADQGLLGKTGPGAWRRQYPNPRRMIEKELRAWKTLIMAGIARSMLVPGADWCGLTSDLLRIVQAEPLERESGDRLYSSEACVAHDLRQRVDRLGGVDAADLAAVIALLPYVELWRLIHPVRFFTKGALEVILPRHPRSWLLVFLAARLPDDFPPAPYREVPPEDGVARMEAVHWQKIIITRGRRPDGPGVRHARPVGLHFPIL